MDEETKSAPAPTSESGQRKVASNDSTAYHVLLTEARTTTSQQLGQINKLDGAAVRSARITFILLGLLAGGSQLPPFPNLGVYGVLGTWALLGSLFSCLFVYGTTHLFIGSSLEELPIDYTEDSVTAHLELIAEYEDGMRANRRVLYLNGFALAIARSLLALSVTFVVLGFVRHPPENHSAVSVARMFIS